MARFKRQWRTRSRKPKVSWVSTLFNETALDRTAAAAANQILLDGADWRAGVASLSQGARVLRLIYNGVIMVALESTAAAQEMSSIIWAIVVADEGESSLGTLNSTASGSLIQAQRVLASGVEGATFLETAGFIVNQVPGFKVNVDWKARVKMRPEDQIVFVAQFQSDASSALSAAAISGFSRVLIEEP